MALPKVSAVMPVPSERKKTVLVGMEGSGRRLGGKKFQDLAQRISNPQSASCR